MRRRSQLRRSRASPPLHNRSRHQRRASRPSADDPPGQEPSDRPRPRTLVAREARDDRPEDETRGGDPLCDLALERSDGLPRRRSCEIDNNIVERAIRPIVLNRKNALFAGSDGGAGHWATIASLVETCKLNGVDPQTYLADVLARIVNDHQNNRIDDLMSWRYENTSTLKAVA